MWMQPLKLKSEVWAVLSVFMILRFSVSVWETLLHQHSDTIHSSQTFLQRVLASHFGGYKYCISVYTHKHKKNILECFQLNLGSDVKTLLYLTPVQQRFIPSGTIQIKESWLLNLHASFEALDKATNMKQWQMCTSGKQQRTELKF